MLSSVYFFGLSSISNTIIYVCLLMKQVNFLIGHGDGAIEF